MSLTPVSKKISAPRVFHKRAAIHDSAENVPGTPASQFAPLRHTVWAPLSRLCMVSTAIIFSAIQFLAQAQSKDILNNEIWALAGGGDTLWMATTKGLNFTTNAGGDTVLWEAFENSQAIPVAFGSQQMLGVFPAAEDQNTNMLWLYRHGERGRDISTGYNHKTIYTRDNEEFMADFQTYEAVWSSGYFWLASADGGLLRIDSTGTYKTVFYPGIEDLAFSSKNFPPQDSAFASFPDTAMMVLGVAADNDSSLWVASYGSIRHFSPSDTMWSQIPAVAPDARYLSVGVNRFSESSFMYATVISGSGNTADSSFYRLSTASGDTAWEKVLEYAPVQASYAPDNRIFTLYDNSIRLLGDSGNGVLEEQTSRSTFQNAILQATGAPTFDLRDILFTATETDTFLWVASDRGLLLSKNPLSSQPEFTSFYREFQVGGNLSEVYAAPGIINKDNQKATFVYEIADSDRATVDIYDWNMDHVIRIEQSRHGSQLPTWDGTFTNNGGKPVAPGVYYFKIHTEKGKRAFGKLVVALSR